MDFIITSVTFADHQKFKTTKLLLPSPTVCIVART